MGMPQKIATFLKRCQNVHFFRKVSFTGRSPDAAYTFRRKSSHASAAQMVIDATVNHHGPQRIGIKTKIRNNSHHPAERFCEGDGATSAVFSEGSIVPSPLSPAHLISYSPLEVPQSDKS
jgi:hypothetical protein